MPLYSTPPAARSVREDRPTLLVCWWCTIFAAVIILFRVCGRYIRTEKLFKEDVLALYCMIPLMCRMALVHVILIYGTNNVITTGLTAQQIYHRELGSRLVLASRIFYAATLWMLKFTILEFFKRLTFNIWRRSHEVMLQCIRYFLVASFVAVLIADIAECQPITHYWQVVPDPGAKCRQGYAQLITMATANVLTDLMLVLFPVPIILSSKMGVKRKIQLVALFGGSLLPVGLTLYRVPNVIERKGGQQYRSLLASVEILFAAAVANALVLGSFVRDKGVKKQRWKLGSVSDSIERTASRRGTAARHWGSDEDLVRDLGLGVDPALREDEPQPRAPPMATSGNTSLNDSKLSRGWQFPGERSDTSDEIDFQKVTDRNSTHSDTMTPRKVSFFDVGGLLEDDATGRRVSSTRTTDTDGESSIQGAQSNWSQTEHTFGLSPAPQRRGSMALLQDIGGLLGPRTSRTRPERSYELQTILQESSPHLDSPPPPTLARQITTHSLQDVGGLLVPKSPHAF